MVPNLTLIFLASFAITLIKMESLSPLMFITHFHLFKYPIILNYRITNHIQSSSLYLSCIHGYLTTEQFSFASYNRILNPTGQTSAPVAGSSPKLDPSSYQIWAWPENPYRKATIFSGNSHAFQIFPWIIPHEKGYDRTKFESRRYMSNTPTLR